MDTSIKNEKKDQNDRIETKKREIDVEVDRRREGERE